VSDTNRVRLRVIGAESLYTNVASTISLTGSTDLGSSPETVVSDVIRSDRQINDLIKVNEEVGGSVDTEFVFGLYEALLYRWALQPDSETIEVLIITSGTVYSGSGVLAAYGIHTGVNIGDWVAFIPEQDATRASIHYVSDVMTDILSIVPSPDLPDGNYPSSNIKRLGYRYNGNTATSFTLEKYYEDIGVYEYLDGCQIDGLSVTVPANGISTATMRFMGLSHSSTTSERGGLISLPNEPPHPMSGAENVFVLQNYAEISGVVTEASLDITNNTRYRNVVGVEGAASLGHGEFSVTGSLTIFFEDEVDLARVLSNTEFSLAFAFTDEAANMFAFELPRCKYSGGVPEVSGKNEDVMITLEFQAMKGADDYTMKLWTGSGII
jgi:hypothetical protein